MESKRNKNDVDLDLSNKKVRRTYKPTVSKPELNIDVIKAKINICLDLLESDDSETPSKKNIEICTKSLKSILILLD